MTIWKERGPKVYWAVPWWAATLGLRKKRENFLLGPKFCLVDLQCQLRAFTLLLFKQVTRNESWGVSFRELADCALWKLGSLFYYDFPLLPHTTAQAKYTLYTKSCGDELNLHLGKHSRSLLLFLFFYADHAETYVWCSSSSVCTKIKLHRGSCVVLGCDIEIRQYVTLH